MKLKGVPNFKEIKKSKHINLFHISFIIFSYIIIGLFFLYIENSSMYLTSTQLKTDSGWETQPYSMFGELEGDIRIHPLNMHLSRILISDANGELQYNGKNYRIFKSKVIASELSREEFDIDGISEIKYGEIIEVNSRISFTVESEKMGGFEIKPFRYMLLIENNMIKKQVGVNAITTWLVFLIITFVSSIIFFKIVKGESELKRSLDFSVLWNAFYYVLLLIIGTNLDNSISGLYIVTTSTIGLLIVVSDRGISISGKTKYDFLRIFLGYLFLISSIIALGLVFLGVIII